MLVEEQIQPGKSQFSRIVVVDDEESILKSIQSLFRKEKYKIYFFTSGQLALEFLEHHEVNLILTDMRMPGISGIELLKRSTLLCPNTIRIIISGYEEKSVIFDAITNGLAQHYIIKPWEDDQLKQIVRESMEFQIQLHQKHLEKILYSFKNLPSLPKVHSRLKEILQENESSQKDIANEIEKSPALVGKLLSISNSIFYGVRKQIVTVSDALTFIGTESVLSIVIGLESFNILSENIEQVVMQYIEEIRIKSVMRAQIARQIALFWNTPVNQHEAYVAGLMLDIGLVLRLCSSVEIFHEFMEKYQSSNQSHYLIDKNLFTITHDKVGAALLIYWNFPHEIISAVENHHCYTGDDPLTTIVQIADMLTAEEDSIPHDPIIKELALYWKEKLNDLLSNIIHPDDKRG